MKQRFLLIILLLLLGIGNTALAIPITYSFEGLGSGSLGGTSFINQNISFELYADTDAVYSGTLPLVLVNDVTGSAINITGFTTASFTTTGLRMYSNDGIDGVGFQDATHLDLLDIIDAALDGYDLTTEIGIIHEPNPYAYNQFVDVSTTMGSMTLSSVSWVDFKATINSVPAPATLGLLGIGLAGISFSTRKKKHSS